MSQLESYGALPALSHDCLLLQLLSNSLILCHTAPYLALSDVLNLAATSRAFRTLVRQNPQVFRRLDLSFFRGAQFEIDAIDHGGETWRNVQVDENLTEDEFYSGPLRGIFYNLRRFDILANVQVLVLDGLSVTADLVHDILNDPLFSVRILSLRGCRHLNERKLRGALQYTCRTSRPEGTPKLKGLYIFGTSLANKQNAFQWPVRQSDPSIRSRNPPTCMRAPFLDNAPGKGEHSEHNSSESSNHETEAWYGSRGRQFRCVGHISPEWAQTLVSCDGLIAFDAVLCSGPRHLNSPARRTVNTALLDAASSSALNPSVPQWCVAEYALGGCAGCGSAPEGWAVWGEEGEGSIGHGHRAPNEIGRFPLLRDPPLHSASIRVAMCPSGQPLRPRPLDDQEAEKARFIPRCAPCLRDRYCVACHRWWCESCYAGPLVLGASPSQVTGMANGTPDAGAFGGGEIQYKPHVSKSCWECGMNCHDCIDHTQRICGYCGGGYCLIHNEGSNILYCDWCSKRGRKRPNL
ncbi:hypothetical protein VTK73DRAFT_9856 [Phialemonium thermophilum]|uniref:F-box domain-containing protein n=1 Tax=Phialemonium thermophilum TaxID=223376 RepID=A0ABR3XIZ7_9PEZI